MGPPGKPAASAPARPGSPAPIASGLLRPTPPNPPRQLPIQSPAATPPWAQSLFFRIKRQATSHLRKKESCAYDLFQGIDELVVLSLPFHTDRGTGASSSILFVYDPAVEPEVELRPITRLYGLTRAEARLLEALVRGERVGTYAKNAGITLNTAKGYLKHLFSKTPPRRQSDLLRLVLSNPLLRLMRPDQA